MQSIELGSLSLSGTSDTQRLGGALAAKLPTPSVIGLLGTLGAGKTLLVSSIAEACGVPPRLATSPTFTLIQPYRTDEQTIYHIDAYRVADVDEFLELGVEELMEQPDAWVFVEWADRVEGVFPPQTLWLELSVTGESGREVTFVGDPEIWKSTISEVIRRCQ